MTGVVVSNLGTGVTETKTFDAAYVFIATESNNEAENSPYRYWIADYVVSFDQDVNIGDVMLAGRYDAFTELGPNWLGFPLKRNLAKDQEVRLLKDMPGDYGFGSLNISVNYEEVCALTQFKCALSALNPTAMQGVTATVELRLYETEAPSTANGNSTNVEVTPENYVTVGTYTYTFQ